MLSFLLDENISHEFAHQIHAKHPDIPIVSIHHWREGVYLQASDREILLAAATEDKTLVTCDVTTIPPLLAQLYEEDRSHGGVVLIGSRTVRSHDFGRLERALVRLWEKENSLDWTDQVVFLRLEQD